MTERRTKPLRGWERWQFLLTGQWIGWFLLTCLFAVICTMLGQWQLHRREHVLDVNAKVSANYDRTPLPFARAAHSFSTLDPGEEWTPVRLEGSYDKAKTLIVRNRTNRSQTGYDVLVPFTTTDGSVVVVDRGWIPLSRAGGGRPDEVPAPPSGRTEVVVRLKPGEPAINRGAPEGQLASIELPAVAAATGLDVKTGAYGQLASENPAPSEPLTAAEHPTLDEGPHLSYAMQWFTFGIMGFVGLAYGARRHAVEVDDEREWRAELAERGVDVDAPSSDRDPVHSHPILRAAENAERRARARTARRGRSTDEDEEDALLESP